LQDLESLLAANDVHILALSTGMEMGSQLLQFVVFGQTKQKGPPIILLQAVQQVLRRRGLGTWALQFLYRECARSRELLAKGYMRAGYMDFLTAKGFILRGGSVKLASTESDRRPFSNRGVLRLQATATAGGTQGTVIKVGGGGIQRVKFTAGGNMVVPATGWFHLPGRQEQLLRPRTPPDDPWSAPVGHVFRHPGLAGRGHRRAA
jgi:hypothetical protein